jgi:hypothetical protein
MKPTIAELIVKTLAAAGVKRICGIVGNSLNGFTEALRKQTAVVWALVRHAAGALMKDPALSKFVGQVSDSGGGRWTVKAAIDEGVPIPVLTTVLYQRSAHAVMRIFKSSCSRPCGSSSADIEKIGQR